ncbi:hypothetical protein [Streptomyces acidicola]|uniref:Uncharacterized protein n=1 Tax=Streptomyces acidicola TaxID=2596892 RepID=A0A5N8WM95_9ACTN|nr:hypothetical protein [Streptomyces acidicola]MPY47644.1 hypothetical protein [Streptomyces acidicola]
MSEAEKPGGFTPSGSGLLSPFRTEERAEGPYESEWEATPAPTALDSPFRAADRQTGRGPVDAESEAVRELLAELYEDELEESLAELLEETAAFHAQHAATTVGRPDPRAVEAPAREWLEPLARQTEAMLESVAEAAGNADAPSLTEAELEELFASAVPPTALGETPAFENFFGAIAKFAKKAVKGAVNLAKKGVRAVGKVMPVGLILGQLKKIVGPLLQRVLKIGIGRLPAPLRPVAATLAKKLLREAPETEAEQAESLAHAPTAHALGQDPEATTPSPAAELALEAAGTVAGLLLARDEQESEDWLAEAGAVLSGERAEAEAYAQDVPAAEAEALDEARERLTEALSELSEGGDPRPALEEFIPLVMAALPLVRKGISVIGRDRVVNMLAGLLAQLIGKWVRPREANILARAIADTGLKLLSLEAEAEDPRRTAATALTATVEDTVRRLARLPAEELEDPVRLEAAAGSAFNAAAAANVPASLLREDLEELEARGLNGTWLHLPRTKPRRFRYKRFSRSFEVTLEARQAAALRTAEGVRLDTLLRDRFRVRTYPVRIVVSLYEAMGGGVWARQIAVAEKKHGRGRGPVALLPLTRQAAGTLLGHPGLGKDGTRPVKGRPLAPGTRLFGIELVGHRTSGARPATGPAGSVPRGPDAVPAGAGDAAGAGVAVAALPSSGRGRPTQVNLTVDARGGREGLVVALYLAEERAQALLNGAGSPPAIGPFLAALATDLADGVVTALLDGAGRRVRIFREAYEQSAQLSPASEGEEFVSALAPRVREALSTGLKRVAGHVLAQYLQGHLGEFVRTLQAPQNGVTLVVTLPGTQLVGMITAVRSGRVPSLAALSSAIRALTADAAAKVEVRAGFHRG